MTSTNHYIVGADIGGTTFTSAIFDSNLKCLDTSEKENVENHQASEDLLKALCNQIRQLAKSNDIDMNEIGGIGISCPGPLDASRGLILDTPNLTQFANFPLVENIEKYLNIPVFIDNDANLFSLGEWTYNYTPDLKVLISVTLGTGLGFGIVINGEIFHGSHGMAAEYGISPNGESTWENGLAIRGLYQLSQKYYQVIHSPEIIYNLAADGDVNALKIWSIYGKRLGKFLSQSVNMLDPDIITIGGGISHAFPFFKGSLMNEISIHSPAYNHYDIDIIESKQKEHSAMLGAVKLVKSRW
ncbi:MAG: ROK family protein [Candidatus Marinimicrobia bacterium]|jgi:glucokinase|nr:ROK family protein [Candidatus Neomarinimicrobiota bacterium]MBT3633315.1 ROK family protein [Candidatus Neomarinimicrobiota bacterium]MBT3681458.1 ROK family protein [Candidatus Neomarinimicrobiota bacterium]MBT3758575.1 ROK family protein [Candidatus Neomarinimicrobiota bacterium]MBT3894771.1 ROK family protein [Candidatus Neomarinimicrobiota bacterium]